MAVLVSGVCQYFRLRNEQKPKPCLDTKKKATDSVNVNHIKHLKENKNALS